MTQTEINPYMADVMHDLYHFLNQRDCEITDASNLEIIKEVIDDAENYYIEAGSKGLFKAEKLQEQLIALRNNISEYEDIYPDVVTMQFHFVGWPRPNGMMHLLNFNEAISLLAKGF